MEFNKLVRDKIPSVIENEGGRPVTRILELYEYSKKLEEKLDEEVAEFHESKELEELVDVLEIIYALVDLYGYSKQDLYEVYRKKHDERGGYKDRVYLIRKE